MRFHFAAILWFFAFFNAAHAGQPFDPTQEKSVAEADGTLKHLWKDLADTDAAKAYRAIWALTKTPKETVAFFAGRLERTAAPDQRQVERWIEHLTSETFAVRDKANVLRRRGVHSGRKNAGSDDSPAPVRGPGENPAPGPSDGSVARIIG
ncbi:MAG: hypothetical protein L0Y71_15035 [Gemmataceae bacterium]|nr:hypothetical protein [Gemmataceae bacterium]